MPKYSIQEILRNPLVKSVFKGEHHSSTKISITNKQKGRSRNGKGGGRMGGEGDVWRKEREGEIQPTADKSEQVVHEHYVERR